MKALTMCQGGNSRSVACGFVLKYELGIDAIACSWEKNSPETLEMLYNWADIIFVMQTHFAEKIPVQYHHKIGAVDVGQDIWFNGLHPELIEKVRGILMERYFAEETPDTTVTKAALEVQKKKQGENEDAETKESSLEAYKENQSGNSAEDGA